MIPASVAAPPSARIIASPYARRLARERGVPLPSIVGSGPEGRIVAGDVPTRAEPSTIRSPALPRPSIAAEPTDLPTSAVTRRIGAYAATLNLAPTDALLAQFPATAEIVVDDLLLKAIGQAMATIGLGEVPLTWRDRGRDTAFDSVQDLPPSLISRRRRDPETRTGAAKSTVLVTRVRETGVRPTQAALDPQSTMRLTIAGGEAACEILLTFDEDRVHEDRAARFLAAVREELELPLRLLV